MPVVAQQPTGRAQRRLEGLFLLASRARATGRRMVRRLMRKPRTVAESPNLLPTLIQVLAAFARVEGELLEEEIDSSLGFLRYDYPEAVYSELRKLFRQALHEHAGPQRDGAAIVRRVSTTRRKILLGVQLYDLISKAGHEARNRWSPITPSCPSSGWRRRPSILSISSMPTIENDVGIYHQGTSPLEVAQLRTPGALRRAAPGLREGERILAYRYNDL